MIGFLVVCFVLCIIAFVAIMVLQSPFSTSRMDHDVYVTLTKEHVSNEELPFVVKQSIQQAQHTLLLHVDKQLTELGIEHWLTGSTLVHAQKYHKLAPWSDTVCIGMEAKHAHKILVSNVCLRTKHGFSFVANNWMSYPAVDVYLFEHQPPILNICTPVNEIGQWTFGDGAKNGVQMSDMFPLKACKIEEEYFFVPNNVSEYMKQLGVEDLKSQSPLVFYMNRQTKGIINMWKKAIHDTLF